MGTQDEDKQNTHKNPNKYNTTQKTKKMSNTDPHHNTSYSVKKTNCVGIIQCRLQFFQFCLCSIYEMISPINIHMPFPVRSGIEIQIGIFSLKGKNTFQEKEVGVTFDKIK